LFLPEKQSITKRKVSMLLFLVAFSCEWCRPGDTASRSTVGVVLLVVCGLIVWCISVASDKRAPWWWKSDQPQDVGETGKEIHKRKHSWRNGLTTHFGSWFSITKKRVSVVSVRSARNVLPPPEGGATRTSVPLINFRRATVSRQTPPKITTTRPESAEVNGVPRTPSDAGVGYA
jgi:hypothetical protein